jgi:peptidoglycan/xylan/chitin deacetylase (PgdA/CDA1 family)
MEIRPCSLAALEYIRRRTGPVALGKAIIPLFGKYLYLNEILTTRRRNACLILCYHGVVPDDIASDPQRYGNVIGAAEFSAQMSFLAQHMTPISLDVLERWLREEADLPENSVLVTFDDGYRNNLSYAADILLRFGIPAAFFPTVGYIGKRWLLWPTEIYRSVLYWSAPVVPLPDGSVIEVSPSEFETRISLATWVREYCKTVSEECKLSYLSRLREERSPELTPREREMCEFLSWRDISKLRNMGFAVGSHTMSHDIPVRLSPARLKYELEESKRQLEKHLSGECRVIAYPNGSRSDYSQAVFQEVERAGYGLALTTNAGLCTRASNRLQLNRICIPGKLSPLAYRTRLSGLHDLSKGALEQVSGYMRGWHSAVRDLRAGISSEKRWSRGGAGTRHPSH